MWWRINLACTFQLSQNVYIHKMLHFFFISLHFIRYVSATVQCEWKKNVTEIYPVCMPSCIQPSQALCENTQLIHSGSCRINCNLIDEDEQLCYQFYVLFIRSNFSCSLTINGNNKRIYISDGSLLGWTHNEWAKTNKWWRLFMDISAVDSQGRETRAQHKYQHKVFVQ